MKIRADVTDFIPRRFGPNNPAQNPVRSSVRHDAGNFPVGHNNAVTEKLGAEKTFNQALSIAIMSQNVLNRALEISARLRNIASAAMTEGRIDSVALNQTVSEINANMESYGEYVPASVHVNAVAETGVKIPSIEADMDRLKDVAMNIRDGEIPGMEILDNLHSSIKGRHDEVVKAIGSFSDSLGEIYSSGDLSGFPSAIAGKTAVEIFDSPGSALNAQGNVHNDAVGRLL